MIKKLCTLCLSVILVAPLMAQPVDRSASGSFAPRAGDWQVSVNLGSGNFFNEYNGMSYLLPTYNSKGGANDVGLPVGGLSTANQSGDPGLVLDLGASFNDNSIVNIVSIQGARFITDKIQVNLTFSLDINVTPKKNFREGVNDVIPTDDPLAVPSYKYIEGRLNDKWMVGAGGNYYFDTKNERIKLYSGACLGFQMARVQTLYPYTGEVSGDDGDDIAVFRPNKRAGAAYAFRGSLVSGVEYSLSEGLLLGFEIQPFSYGYSLVKISPQGLGSFNASHSNYKFLSFPVIKLGIRF